MSTPQRPTDIDDYIRRLTQADPAVVRRVVARALRVQSNDPSRSRRWTWVAAVVAVVLVAAAGMWRWRSSPTVGESSITITGNSALVIVERGDGQRWVVASAPSEADRGNYVIVVER